MKANRSQAAAAIVAFVALAISQSLPACAEITVEVGGVPMSPSKTIMENAAESKVLTTLAAGIETAGLAPILADAGPFTLFAPVDKAFEKLPKGRLEEFLKAEGETSSTPLVAYHILPGKYSAADFVTAIKRGGGRAEFQTIAGGTLAVEQDGRKLIVVDGEGKKSVVTILDVPQKNGIIHVIDRVLAPKE